jgi:hypothetical protein
LKAYQVYIYKSPPRVHTSQYVKKKLLSKTIIWTLLWAFEKMTEIDPLKVHNYTFINNTSEKEVNSRHLNP